MTRINFNLRSLPDHDLAALLSYARAMEKLIDAGKFFNAFSEALSQEAALRAAGSPAAENFELPLAELTADEFSLALKFFATFTDGISEEKQKFQAYQLAATILKSLRENAIWVTASCVIN